MGAGRGGEGGEMGKQKDENWSEGGRGVGREEGVGEQVNG